MLDNLSFFCRRLSLVVYQLVLRETPIRLAGVELRPLIPEFGERHGYYARLGALTRSGFGSIPLGSTRAEVFLYYIL